MDAVNGAMRDRITAGLPESSGQDDVQLIFDAVVGVHSAGGSGRQLFGVPGSSPAGECDTVKVSFDIQITDKVTTKLLNEFLAAVGFRVGAGLSSHAFPP